MLKENTNVAVVGRAQTGRRLLLGDVCKFTAMAALLAIFVDAVIGHAMLWGNDPYWTYWITDTLLMATVFGLGTAWVGIGLVRGALITAAHMLLLTTYYWSLSPIGLPSQPVWLDLEHTWVTGLPVHFGVYYLGYVTALWIWRHRAARNVEPEHATARLATGGVVLAVAIVVGAGLLQALFLGHFPGITWFVMRIAVASAFTIAWWSVAGRDRNAAVVGGITLGFLLVAYGHFLGPVGLPNSEFRLLTAAPPPAEVHWLSYRQEFLIILPTTILLAVSGYLLAGWSRASSVRWRAASITAVTAPTLALVLLGGGVALYTGPEAKTAFVSAEGSASLGGAPSDGGDMASGSATLRMRVADRNPRGTPLPPHDLVDIDASISALDGTTYTIHATEPMVAEPRGLFSTWYGVGFDVWHHGRSGIGYAGLPSTESNVAVYALGTVREGEQILATGVPIHVMTSSRPGARLELHIGQTQFQVPGIPGGYLRAVWPEYEGGHDQGLSYAQYAWGGGVLGVLLCFAIAAARREQEQNNGDLTE